MTRLTSGRLRILAVVVLCLVSVVAPAAAAQSNETDPCRGTVTDAADGVTVISVQGARFAGDDAGKKPAKLVGVGPDGDVRWVHDSDAEDVVWSYDVDPLPNGNVFVTAAIQGERTRVSEFDPETQEHVWSEEFDFADTHDADLIDGGEEVVLANMRNADPENGTNGDRIVVYNRTRGEVTWEWRFDDHFDESVGGNYSDDWTHVNDVDAVGDDRFVISPRNFDSVLVINRTTDEIELRLGEHLDHDVLRKQHNPDYLESEDGAPTLLVADSDNDRIVEYERSDDGWERTWELGSSDSLDWPRDADRLSNGNTLVSDSKNHRVIEVTPEGEIVWEAYAPWLVYDAARLSHVEESAGDTIADMGATGTAALSGSSDAHRQVSELEACDEALRAFENPTPSEGTAATTGDGSTAGDRTETTRTGDGDDGDADEGAVASDGQAGFGLAAPVVALLLYALRRP